MQIRFHENWIERFSNSSLKSKEDNLRRDKKGPRNWASDEHFAQMPAAQIYAGTWKVKWYASYFDDPTDQAAIKRGFGYFTNGLPVTTSSSFVVSPTTRLAAESLFTSEERTEIKKRAEINSQKIKNGERLSFD